MKDIGICENRMKNMITLDKSFNPIKIEKVLKSEIIYLLKKIMVNSF